MNDSDPIDYNVVGTVPKANDLEVAVRVAEVEGERIVDVRDYVPSLDFYGRGITVPAEACFDLSKLIGTARTR